MSDRARLHIKFATQLCHHSKMEPVFLGSPFMRARQYTRLRRPDQPCCPHASPGGCVPCGPSPTAMGLGPVAGPSENRSQLTSSAPWARQQELFNVLNFLPAMKSEQPVQEKQNLAKQRHLPCSLNMPQETFWKENGVHYTQAHTCSHKPNFMLCWPHN